MVILQQKVIHQEESPRPSPYYYNSIVIALYYGRYNATVISSQIHHGQWNILLLKDFRHGNAIMVGDASYDDNIGVGVGAYIISLMG
jgi:hypothetical protein